MGTTVLLGMRIGEGDGEGAACVMGTSVLVFGVLGVALIRRHGLPLPLTRESARPSVRTMRTVVMLGAPLAVQDMCNKISYLIAIGLVNALGVTVSAGVGIAEKLSMFILLVPVSYMQSVSAFVAQNTGAGQHTRARRAMWHGMASAAALGGAVAALGFFGGGALSSLFIDDAAVISVSAEFLKATSIECFILSIAYCFAGYFNGVGRTRFVMAQGIIAVLAVRVPFAWYMSTRPDPVVLNIGLSETAAAIFALAACAAYYAVSSHGKKGMYRIYDGNALC